MTHMEIRNMWLNYFSNKGHKIVESASLIPINDDSLLWINAGVTPLKKYFDGTEIPSCKRLTNIQKCIRTNDIENVGVTKRHQTFFEMMGNFSIGDYFKKEAIEFAWELLTGENYFAIPKEKLYVTVYTKDEEATKKWLQVGMLEDHIIALEGNFWEIGAGPCGPDSEIFYDRGEKYDEKDHTALEKFKKDEEQERFIEIWNNVFSQFNSEEKKKREEYKELPHKNIDTGAGLERWCLIFQDVDSNFETDLFMPIMSHMEDLSGIHYSGQTEFKIIADHIRALTFALSDGATFSNTGRGYVLRRLLRRSVRAGKKLGIKENFLYKLVSTVIKTMQEAYPYLKEKQGIVEIKILEEERLFLSTLNDGERILKEMLKSSPDGILSGADAFKLYDTYGFPIELTEEYLHELGYTTNREEFEKYMITQRELAKKANRTKSSMASQKKVLLDFTEKSTFTYGIYRLKTNILAIFSKDSLVSELDHDGYIALKRTCFYATQGGQINDTGMIIGEKFKARVVDVFKGPNGQNIHKIKLLDGKIEVGDTCELIVDKERRKQIEANHSSVHLLHYALREVINKDIRQAGSYVDNDRLRFDFTYSGKITEEDIIKVEDEVNRFINKKQIISTETMPIDKAKKLGAIALFSEKYGDIVRVVKMGKSIELCGGTHANNTKDIQRFAIFSCESKGSNIYRIEAVTNSKIETTLFNIIKPYNDEMIKLLMKAKAIIDEAAKIGIRLDFDITINNDKPTSYKDIIFNQNELSYIQTEVKELEKKYFTSREEKVLKDLDRYRKNIKDYNGTKSLIMEFKHQDMELLKSIADAIMNELKEGIIFFVNVKEDHSVNFLCRSNCNINAGYIVKEASIISLGNGGGSNSFATGGGKTDTNLKEVYSKLEKVLNHEI